MNDRRPALLQASRISLLTVMGAWAALLALSVLFSEHERSLRLEAQTYGMQINFVGDSNVWALDNAIVCRPLPVPNLRAPTSSTDLCPPNLYTQTALPDGTINWPAGLTVDLLIDRADALSIQVVHMPETREGTIDLPVGSYIIVKKYDWARHGALTFSATARIGELIATGSRNHLISGHWEFRQGGYAVSLAGDVVETVKRGDLDLGVSALATASGANALLYGSITPVSIASSFGPNSAMHVSAISAKGPVELHLYNFGLPNAVVIRPNWIDRVSSSSTFFALASIVAFIATGHQLLTGLGLAKLQGATTHPSTASQPDQKSRVGRISLRSPRRRI